MNNRYDDDGKDNEHLYRSANYYSSGTVYQNYKFFKNQKRDNILYLQCKNCGKVNIILLDKLNAISELSCAACGGELDLENEI